MPFTKRAIRDPFTYSHSDIYEHATPGTILQDTHFTRTIGVIQQISYLSSYAFEIFDGLTLLTEDVKARITATTARTCKLLGQLGTVEKRVTSYEMRDGHSGKKTKKFLKSRADAFTPTVLTRNTTPLQVTSQYAICLAPPPLWKIETIIGAECMQYYSNPALFFEEWLRVELQRQEVLKAEKKKTKALKKLMKMERRERRKNGEDWTALTKRGQRERKKASKGGDDAEEPLDGGSRLITGTKRGKSVLFQGKTTTTESDANITATSATAASTPQRPAAPPTPPPPPPQASSGGKAGISGLFGFMKGGSKGAGGAGGAGDVSSHNPEESTHDDAAARHGSSPEDDDSYVPPAPVSTPPPSTAHQPDSGPKSDAGRKARNAIQSLSAIRKMNVTSTKRSPALFDTVSQQGENESVSLSNIRPVSSKPAFGSGPIRAPITSSTAKNFKLSTRIVSSRNLFANIDESIQGSVDGDRPVSTGKRVKSSARGAMPLVPEQDEGPPDADDDFDMDPDMTTSRGGRAGSSAAGEDEGNSLLNEGADFDMSQVSNPNRWSSPNKTRRRSFALSKNLHSPLDMKSMIDSATSTAAAERPTQVKLLSRRLSIRPQTSKLSALAKVALDNNDEEDNKEQSDADLIAELIGNVNRQTSGRKIGAATSRTNMDEPENIDTNTSNRWSSGLTRRGSRKSIVVSFGDDEASRRSSQAAWDRLIGRNSLAEDADDEDNGEAGAYVHEIDDDDAPPPDDDSMPPDEDVDENRSDLRGTMGTNEDDEDIMPPDDEEFGPDDEQSTSLAGSGSVTNRDSSGSNRPESRRVAPPPPPGRPPQSQAAGAPPPPPPKINKMASSGVLGDLMDASTKANLRRAPEVVKVVDARTNLLSAIKSGNTALKKVETEEKKPQKVS
jgi:hypothetical protein